MVSDDKIGCLYGIVVKCCFFGKLWVGGKLIVGIVVRK